LTWTSPCEDWLLTSLKEKLIKIGAKVASHGRYVAFQMAEVAIPRNLFADILRLIAELRPPPDAAARVKRHVVVRLRAKPTGKVRLDDNEIRFWAFATPMSAAWEHPADRQARSANWSRRRRTPGERLLRLGRPASDGQAKNGLYSLNANNA